MFYVHISRRASVYSGKHFVKIGNFNFQPGMELRVYQKYLTVILPHRRRKRGGQGGGPGPPNNLKGGPTYPLPPPNNPPTFSFNFYVKQEKITNVPS